MSLYRFFASDKEMPAFDNTNPMAVAIDKNLHNINYISNEESLIPLRIFKEEDMTYASAYTKQPYINFLEGDLNNTNAQIIVNYIKALMENRFSIFLFNTWMDDKSEVMCKKINVADLTIEDVKNIWAQDSFVQNECLQIFKRY